MPITRHGSKIRHQIAATPVMTAIHLAGGLDAPSPSAKGRATKLPLERDRSQLAAAVAF
jgi:hypothetical protein